MKTSFKFLIAGLTLALANSAMAAATMKDVETAVNVNHDYRLAEKLIGELTASNPDDARDHWVYAQILHHNGKDDKAMTELADAKRLDSKYSFVKDPHKVAQFEASLNAHAAPAYVPAPIQAPVTHHDAIVAQPVQAPIPAPAPHKSSHVWIWVLLILAVVCVAAYFFARRVQAGDRQEEEDRTRAARQDQLKQANTLLESVKPFKLDLRIANPPRPDLISQLEDVERDLVSLIERLAQAPVTPSAITQLSQRLDALRRQFEGKPEPVAPAQPASQNRPGQFNDNEFSPVGAGNGGSVYQQPLQGQPMQQVYQPPMQPVYQQPQTVYVEENNGIGAGGGFVAGMVMGSLLGGDHHEREVIHEVREVREIREVPEPRYERNQQAQSDIDFGQESTSDSSGSSSDSGVDFGNSDDDDN